MKTMKILAALVVATGMSVQEVQAWPNKTQRCAILTAVAAAVAGATEYQVRSAKERNVNVSNVIKNVNTAAKIATGVFAGATAYGTAHHVAKRSNSALARVAKRDQDKNLLDRAVSVFVGSEAVNDRVADLGGLRAGVLTAMGHAGIQNPSLDGAEAAITAAETAVTQASGDAKKDAQKKVDALKAAAKLHKKIAAFSSATGQSV